MLLPSLLPLALLPAVLALPFSASTLEKRNNTSVYTGPELNITYTSPDVPHLPKTLILATGGTIAGSSSSSTDSTGYRAGSIGVAALVEAVPELLNVSVIHGMQVANVGSPSISDAIVLNISKVANLALCSENAEYDAVVVTHGTDTLEETAYFLDATLTCNKTLVVVGAMRPATAISADGPNNLLSAVTTAVTPDSHGRGVLVVLNDRICQAFYCAKRHANALDTFQAPEQGFVGALLSIKPYFYYPPSQPTFKTVWDVSAGVTYDWLNTSIANGAKGFVSAGTGSGGVASAASAELNNAVAQGFPVVRSTKVNNGVSPPSEGSTTIASGWLNPVKSRRLLQILLALGKSNDEIREVFEGRLNEYLNFNLTTAY
ncbi:hypothetical protein JCM10207_005436 [Rhodosporidiobolus poonsookiae]